MENEWWAPFIAGGAIPVFVYYATHGVKAVIEARRARAAKVEEDERDAAERTARNWRARMVWLEKQCTTAERLLAVERGERVKLAQRTQVLDDYAYRLRQQVAECGGVPHPWPPYGVD